MSKVQSKIDNPEKLATQGTQDEKLATYCTQDEGKQNNNPTQYVLDTTIQKQTQK